MDLLNLISENNNQTNENIKNTAFLNIYLVQGDQRLQITGLGLESQINSRFTTKNQKDFFKKLLNATVNMPEGERKKILNGIIELELLKVGSKANEELTDSLLSMLDI